MQVHKKMQPQPWIKPRVKELRKTLRALGQAMGGLDGSRVNEVMAGTRRVKAVEVGPMAKFLELPYDDVYGRLFGITPESRVNNDSHETATSRIDTTPTVLIPQWEVEALGGAEGGVQLQLTKTESWASAPQEMRLSKNSFAVQAWDDDNAPWVRRGAMLFVNPFKKPRDGDWTLFAGSGDPITGILKNPSVGLLLFRKGNGWAVQRGAARLVLSMAEWPTLMLIEWIKP